MREVLAEIAETAEVDDWLTQIMQIDRIFGTYLRNLREKSLFSFIGTVITTQNNDVTIVLIVCAGLRSLARKD